MLKCIDNLNQLGYVHLDVKLDNFFLDCNMNLVLADLGSCHILLNSDTDLTPLNRFVGTKEYCSYEIYCKDYGNKSDIWSAGICMYMMFTGININIDLDNFIKFKKVKLPHISKEGNDLLNKMICPSYIRRINVKTALAHPFLNNKLI